jgi:hypothetical protein
MFSVKLRTWLLALIGAGALLSLGAAHADVRLPNGVCSD